MNSTLPSTLVCILGSSGPQCAALSPYNDTLPSAIVLRSRCLSWQGIKPYQCSCGSKYQRKKNLQAHEKNCAHHHEQLLREHSLRLKKSGPTYQEGFALSEKSKETVAVNSWMQAGGSVPGDGE